MMQVYLRLILSLLCVYSCPTVAGETALPNWAVASSLVLLRVCCVWGAGGCPVDSQGRLVPLACVYCSGTELLMHRWFNGVSWFISVYGQMNTAVFLFFQSWFPQVREGFMWHVLRRKESVPAVYHWLLNSAPRWTGQPAPQAHSRAKGTDQPVETPKGT